MVVYSSLIHEKTLMFLKRHCPFCKKHTEHKITEAKKQGRGKAHPLSKFGDRKTADRGVKRGCWKPGKNLKATY
jgi:ribosomal protein L44E